MLLPLLQNNLLTEEGGATEYEQTIDVGVDAGASLTRSIGKFVSATADAGAAAVKDVGKFVETAADAGASASKVAAKALGVAAGCGSAIGKGVGATRTIAVAVGASVARGVGKIVSAIVAAATDVAASRAYLVTIDALARAAGEFETDTIVAPEEPEQPVFIGGFSSGIFIPPRPPRVYLVTVNASLKASATVNAAVSLDLVAIDNDFLMLAA